MGDVQAMAVAVVGVGRMGRHHARVYRGLPGVSLAAVVDSDGKRAGEAAIEHGCVACADVEELLRRFPHIAAVSIAVPTVHHLAAARPLLERGVACLVEKPLAGGAEEARELLALAERQGAVLQVGHTERFNPAVRAVVALGLRARYIEVDRISPMTFRSLDVGVVMDMMIHDLDIVLTLAGSPLARVDATGVPVMGKHEDVANARLVFASGCVANLTASRLALKTERRMRLFSEDAYVNLDYQKRSGLVIRRSDNAESLQRIRQRLAAGEDLSAVDYAGLVKVERLHMDLPPGQEDPLTAELGSFLDCVREKRRPVVDGRAGLAAVETAERVMAAMGEHRWEGLERAEVKV